MEKIVPQKKGSLATRILEAFGITRACVQSIGSQEDTVHVNLPLDYSDSKTIEAALLEAEQQKAKAITQLRRQKFI
jgi:aspartokinase